MATFDQHGQQVVNQYNAGHDINFGAVETSADLANGLEELKSQIAQAKESGTITEETATDAEYQITKAIQQTQKPKPDKKTILDHLTTAKALIENIAAAGGLVTTVVQAIQTVQKLFS